MMSKNRVKRQRTANKPPAVYLQAADDLDQLLIGRPTNEVMRRNEADARKAERERQVNISHSAQPVVAIIDRQICLKCGEAQSFLRCVGRRVTTPNDSNMFQFTLGIEATLREIIVSRIAKCPACLSTLPATYKESH